MSDFRESSKYLADSIRRLGGMIAEKRKAKQIDGIQDELVALESGRNDSRRELSKALEDTQKIYNQAIAGFGAKDAKAPSTADLEQMLLMQNAVAAQRKQLAQFDFETQQAQRDLVQARIAETGLTAEDAKQFDPFVLSQSALSARQQNIESQDTATIGRNIFNLLAERRKADSEKAEAVAKQRETASDLLSSIPAPGLISPRKTRTTPYSKDEQKELIKVPQKVALLDSLDKINTLVTDINTTSVLSPRELDKKRKQLESNLNAYLSEAKKALELGASLTQTEFGFLLGPLGLTEGSVEGMKSEVAAMKSVDFINQIWNIWGDGKIAPEFETKLKETLVRGAKDLKAGSDAFLYDFKDDRVQALIDANSPVLTNKELSQTLLSDRSIPGRVRHGLAKQFSQLSFDLDLKDPVAYEDVRKKLEAARLSKEKIESLIGPKPKQKRNGVFRGSTNR